MIAHLFNYGAPPGRTPNLYRPLPHPLPLDSMTEEGGGSTAMLEQKNHTPKLTPPPPLLDRTPNLHQPWSPSAGAGFNDRGERREWRRDVGGSAAARGTCSRSAALPRSRGVCTCIVHGVCTLYSAVLHIVWNRALLAASGSRCCGSRRLQGQGHGVFSPHLQQAGHGARLTH